MGRSRAVDECAKHGAYRARRQVSVSWDRTGTGRGDPTINGDESGGPPDYGAGQFSMAAASSAIYPHEIGGVPGDLVFSSGRRVLLK